MIRQRYNSNFVAGNDRRCNDLLRRLLRNPPNNTKIAINIGLSKARYLCHEGFKLVGKKVRTCKGGKWRERVEPKCLSKFKWELKIPCYIHNIQRFWTSLTRTRNFNGLYFFVLFVRRLGLQEALTMHWSIDLVNYLHQILTEFTFSQDNNKRLETAGKYIDAALVFAFFFHCVLQIRTLW